MSDPSTANIESLLEHSDWVRALARTLVRDVAAAEDLAQDALLVALQRPPRDARNLRGWFARVLRNLQRERGRREAGHSAEFAQHGAATTLPPTLDLVERAEAQHLLIEEVIALDEPYRTTVLLRYFEHQGPQAIAALQRVPLSTVTSRLTRATPGAGSALPSTRCSSTSDLCRPARTWSAAMFGARGRSSARSP